MKKLSESEFEIMRKIWDTESSLTLEEVIIAVEEKKWSVHTVRNFLTRIVDKGYLRVDKVGRKNLYVPIVLEDYMNNQSKSMIKRLYDGSVQNFVAQLYETDDLSKKDLMDLKIYLDDLLEEK
ncbi:MAG: BlaI/MecI/CopY family transcriptional regulator [Clostridium sp.]|jgi:predicted transcriptional regulator|nr:BlaI/MecI/CopY family transcriptional regulator [Clostridium sp.]